MVPTGESAAPLPAALLMRVAEAADGIRDGTPRWFVVSRTAPYDLTAFEDEKTAHAALKKKKPAADYALLGPYVAGAKPAVRGARKKKDKIKSIQIHYQGKKKPLEIDPAKVDAIFLSESAKDKFLYPYYSRVRGVEGMVRMRSAHMEADDEPFFHTPLSEPWP